LPPLPTSEVFVEKCVLLLAASMLKQKKLDFPKAITDFKAVPGPSPRAKKGLGGKQGEEDGRADRHEANSRFSQFCEKRINGYTAKK
jgi:hypothetical protein